MTTAPENRFNDRAVPAPLRDGGEASLVVARARVWVPGTSPVDPGPAVQARLALTTHSLTVSMARPLRPGRIRRTFAPWQLAGLRPGSAGGIVAGLVHLDVCWDDEDRWQTLSLAPHHPVHPAARGELTRLVTALSFHLNAQGPKRSRRWELARDPGDAVRDLTGRGPATGLEGTLPDYL